MLLYKNRYRLVIYFVFVSFLISLIPSCADSSVSIDEKHFPDIAFREAVSEFDANNNGTLSARELKDLKELSVARCSNLSGIEYLTSLEELNVGHAHFTNEVSFFSDLSILRLSFTYCTFDSDVNLNGCRVKRIKFDCCKFNSKVDISNCSSLVSTDFEYCKILGGIDLSGCSELVKFYGENFYGEGKCVLNLSGCMKLERFSLSGSVDYPPFPFSKIDLKSCAALNHVFILAGEELKELDIADSPNIAFLQLEHSGIQVLDISDNPYLISLIEQTPGKGDSRTVCYSSDNAYILCDSAIEFAT